MEENSVLTCRRPVNAPPGYIKNRKLHDLLKGDKEFKELVTKIDVNVLMASVFEISHASEIMVWVEVTQILMWLG
jgi:hypothetical protein